MKPFSVLLSRSVVHQARVDVHAEDEAEARQLAEQRATDDMVAWTEVHREVGAEVRDD
jgi:hypothetical protein